MTITRERADAIVVHIASPIAEHWPQFIEFARRRRLPTAAAQRRFVLLGGLMHYGPNTSDLARRAASYVDRILRGANPGDLPVEQPTKFELIIKLGTAKVLGLTLPPSLLAGADEIVE